MIKCAPWERSSQCLSVLLGQHFLPLWPVSELKVASGKPRSKHCSKRISQEQEGKENRKKSRPFKQMPPKRAPVFLLSPGINTRGTTLPPCWIYSLSRSLVSTNQTFFASEIRKQLVRQICVWVSRESNLRTTCEQLSSSVCFVFPSPVLSILAAKFPRIVFFRKVFLCCQLY